METEIEELKDIIHKKYDIYAWDDELEVILKLSYNQGLKDVCNDKIKLGYFKTGYGQGIQKAIDIVEDLKKSVEEVGYENLSDQSYYNALCDVKIQLNQEVKHE